MNNILYELCLAEASWIKNFNPRYSYLRISDIVKKCGISTYEARKELQKLKTDGYVKIDNCIFFNEKMRRFGCRAWGITEKAKSTEEFKKAVQEIGGENNWVIGKEN